MDSCVTRKKFGLIGFGKDRKCNNLGIEYTCSMCPLIGDFPPWLVLS